MAELFEGGRCYEGIVDYETNDSLSNEERKRLASAGERASRPHSHRLIFSSDTLSFRATSSWVFPALRRAFRTAILSVFFTQLSLSGGVTSPASWITITTTMRGAVNYP